MLVLFEVKKMVNKGNYGNEGLSLAWYLGVNILGIRKL